MVAPQLVESSGAIFLYIPAHADSGGNRMWQIPHTFPLHTPRQHIIYHSLLHRAPYTISSHAIRICETGRIALRNGPFYNAKWAESHCNSAHFVRYCIPRHYVLVQSTHALTHIKPSATSTSSTHLCASGTRRHALSMPTSTHQACLEACAEAPLVATHSLMTCATSRAQRRSLYSRSASLRPRRPISRASSG